MTGYSDEGRVDGPERSRVRTTMSDRISPPRRVVPVGEGVDGGVEVEEKHWDPKRTLQSE